MRLIDEQYILHPYMGVPKMTVWLQKDKGYAINPKRIERLYKLLDISAIVPKPYTSKKGKGKSHKIYKYLLKNLKINRPNQVWATDITYIPVTGGYIYLVAIIDIYSRFVVGWSLSNTMTTQWCMQTLEEAIAKYGKPDILNTDQGSQFTALSFTQYVTEKQNIQLSMDGKGRAIDNVFIERLWRSLKYEHVYIKQPTDGLECYKGLKEWFQNYNHQRRHQNLDYEHPINIYKQTIKSVA